MQSQWIKADEPQQARMDALEALGFKPLDALHVACAEAGACDVLLTTDRGFLRKAKRHSGLLQVKVENPLDWLAKELSHADAGDDH